MEKNQIENSTKTEVLKNLLLLRKDRLLHCFGVLFLLSLLMGCGQKTKTEFTLFYNGKIYTCDSVFTISEAMIIRADKVLETGTTEQLLGKYPHALKVDIAGKAIYPGLFDAHCHFYALGKLSTQINLQNIGSWDEILDSLWQFRAKNPAQQWIVGRGWDQTLFANQKFPNKTVLDSLFPNVPVLLRRVDGHAAIANQRALNLAGINTKTIVAGGEIEVINGSLTGILIDNAVDKITEIMPAETNLEIVQNILKAQEMCLSVGLTAITDAGLSPKILSVMDSLYLSGDLKIRINAMISANNEGLEYAMKKGPIIRENFRVKSIKIYGDGALGSRGALLKQPYCDRKNHKGLQLTATDTIKKYCQWAAINGFQVCTHAIGDSANRLILDIYGSYTANKDLRWRIEHAQVVDVKDILLFGKYGIIPSVQPTHATSDSRWAEDRICADRLKGAYAYLSLLNSYKKIALGTDFPIEDYLPSKTFFAAVYRQNSFAQTGAGFLMEEALTPFQALMGMTHWAAFAQFDEHRLGQIRPGYKADFIVTEDWFGMEKAKFEHWKPEQVYLDGKKCN